MGQLCHKCGKPVIPEPDGFTHSFCIECFLEVHRKVCPLCNPLLEIPEQFKTIVITKGRDDKV